MPGIELHADFDRDGKLTGNAAERAARLVEPGAIVVPNLDRDQRVLPSSIATGNTPVADFEIATAFAADNELLPLQIRVASGALGAGERLAIRCSGVMHTRVRLSNAVGIIVPQRLGDPAVFELPPVPPAGVLGLTLQVKTIAGASFGRATSLEPRFQADTREESRFELRLLRVDASGQEHVEDQGRFFVAPVIFADRMASAIRLYIVNAPDNQPSVEDVRTAAAVAAVPLVEVPVRLTGNDAWLQDQYQHGLMQGADRSRQIIVHLPRFRHDNSDATVTDNLEDFVNSHFRSRDIAMFNDLWDRIITVNTSQGGVLRINFRQIRAWVASAGRVLRVAGQLDHYGMLVDRKWKPMDDDNWVNVLRGLKSHLVRLTEAIDRAIQGASQERTTLLTGLKKAAEELVQAALADHSTTGPDANRTVQTLIAGQSVSLSEDTARRLFTRGNQMQDASNYGGNIESTPPVADAPLGKVIVGNFVFPEDRSEFVDPDLLRVLAKQKKQPIVEINTAWLKVGHVDEMAAVVPHAPSGFSILHASSLAAITILQEAEARYINGLSIYHPDRINIPRRPSGVTPRLMTDGTSPVTRLFRGKAWRHAQPAPYRGQVPDVHEPPTIYLRLAFEMSAADGFNVHRIGVVPGEGDVRRYPADITPSEILFCERDAFDVGVNEAVDASMLEPSRKILAKELNVPILPAPVLWDRVDNFGLFRATFWRRPTTAFSPNMANLEVLNGHLIVPKPYGPRMYRTDAVYVVRTTMRRLKLPAAIRDRVGQRLIAARKMTREQYWVESVDRVEVEPGATSIGGMRTQEDVIDAFKDSFPDAKAEELQKLIIKPNAVHFDSNGYLKKRFTKLVIDDKMVDLFELFFAAIAEHLGVKVHFVDSWFYHLGDGEIHCGTNVLRRPQRLRVNAWDAPDALFRSQTIYFDEAETVESAGAK
jgi:hypothetical protein